MEKILEHYIFGRASIIEFQACMGCVHVWLYAMSDDNNIVMIGEDCNKYIADKSGLSLAYVNLCVDRLNKCGYSYVRNNLAKVRRP